ncbi:MAG: molybdopterin-dependent oxidoreductase, partial [Deltaproteobacteria bacterium]
FQILLVILAAPAMGVRNAIAARFPTRTVEKKNFEFDPSTGMIRWIDTGESEEYRLVVDGLVKAPASLTYNDLRAFPSITRTRDFHCVEGWTVPRVRWSGFLFKELLDKAEPLNEAKYVVFHALGETTAKPRGLTHYVESFKVESLLDPAQEILMVLQKDGKPLSLERGAPLRLIAPYRLGYKSIKFVARVEFSNRKRFGWWTLFNPIYTWEAAVSKRRLRKGQGER